MPNVGAWAFGDYLLDAGERRLTRGGAVVALAPKAFDLLVALVERGGRLLSRTELISRLWPDTVVEEGTLSRHVSSLRKALGQANGSSLVQTVHKSGYRLRGEVRPVRLPGTPTPALPWLGGPPWLGSADDVALARPSPHPLAHEAYLRGRWFWSRRTAGALRKALGCFEKASALDPAFAAADAGRADVLALLAGYVLPPTAYAQARTAAERALALDTDLADAHVARGLIAQKGDRDWTRAQEEYRRALELQPRHVTALQRWGELLALRGRPQEGLALLGQARQLDPVSAIVGTDLAKACFFARDYPAAVAECLQVLEIEPGFGRARLYIGLAEILQGRTAVGLAEIRAFARAEQSGYALGVLAFAHGVAGEDDGARELLEQLRRRRGAEYITPYAFALAHLGLGDHDRALGSLAQAVDSSNDVLVLGVSPLWDPLRGDARFRELLERAALAHG
jgi:DNA-binding winged helix-turn-helix (wHTH) protein/tetratricopeptide (TPR) repeat protein